MTEYGKIVKVGTSKLYLQEKRKFNGVTVKWRFCCHCLQQESEEIDLQSDLDLDNCSHVIRREDYM